MALTPQTISQALATRPELNRFSSAKLAQDQGSFKAALTSQLGVSQEILGSKSRDPLSLFTSGADVQAGDAARNPRGLGGQGQGALQGGVSAGPPGIRQAAALTALAGSHAQQAARPQGAQAHTAAAKPVARADASKPAPAQAVTGQVVQTAAAQPAQAQAVKGQVAANSVRASVDKGSRHPEDLGHLPPGGLGGMGTGFTREEEDLLQAAAAAESRFLAAKRGARSRQEAQADRSDKLGILSASYESRGAIDAIGYDGRGGTSYGLYQIASGVGTLDRFLDYLDVKAPDISQRLSRSGPGNTGGRGGAMAEEWKRVSAQEPKRFEALQHDFIRETHYQPALKSITLSTGDDLSKRSQAVREVLWSTAVQHGPNGASEIFNQALDTLQAKGGTVADKALIEEVYAQRMAQFGGRGRLRAAVTGRLADEKDTALAMLGGKSLG